MNRYLRYVGLAIALTFSLALAFTISGISPAYMASTANPVRHLSTVQASPGQTFQVAVNFTAPANNFLAIGLVDNAPEGWTVSVNPSWSSPTPMADKSNANNATYIWSGPFSQGTVFNAVYRVTAPVNCPPGNYNFLNSIIRYTVDKSAPFSETVSGDSTVGISQAAASTLPVSNSAPGAPVIPYSTQATPAKPAVSSITAAPTSLINTPGRPSNPQENIISVSGFSATNSLIINSENKVKEAVTLITPDTSAMLYIPAGTKIISSNSPSSLSLSSQESTVLPEISGFKTLSAYSFNPEGIRFEPPITLTMRYSLMDLPPGTKESDLTISYRENSQWMPLGCALNATSHTISTNINRLSPVALMAAVHQVSAVQPLVSNSVNKVSVGSAPINALSAPDMQDQSFNWSPIWAGLEVIAAVGLISGVELWRRKHSRKSRLPKDS
jgi:hypothetical protein